MYTIRYEGQNLITYLYSLLMGTKQIQEQTVDMEDDCQELPLQSVCLQTILQLFCGVSSSHAQCC